ncbi:Zinc transporter 5 [Fasciola gigantica]|uniref:Proton-coupled zinc antiporter SLC30A5 n=1 Tax=Fasciola gigantica TaxID=46835 RepID=A0A504YPB2_FASGI|nr:Zinc transporter 5 [Fasciola gigantica]
MEFGSQAVIYPKRGVRSYEFLIVLSKLLKAVAFFAAYDVLKKLHTVTFLLLLKICAVVILLPLQKPFSSGQPIRSSEWLQITKFSLIRIFLDILWIEGLSICGPLRFVLLFEHSELILLAVASTIVYGAVSTQRVRGTIFFTCGILSIAFFDQDNALLSNKHPEGVHKSLLIHKIYEFFVNFGFSDHKTGVLILLVTVSLDAAFAATSRALVASLGGAKRLHALSALVSSCILVVIFLVSRLLGWTALPYQGHSLGSLVDGREDELPVDSGLSFGQSTVSVYVFLWMAYIGAVLILDFYLMSVASTRLGVQTVTNLGKLTVTMAAFALCFLWSSDSGFSSFTSSAQQIDPSAQTSTLSLHSLSTGVVLAALAILYATSLLTRTKPGQGPEGGSSGHFIGYSMTGLPLFTPGQTPSHGMALLNNPEHMGLGYHVRETLRGIMAEQSSRRIFVFLCLNLSFTFVELLYGVWTNSLGLISDGFHMLFDSTALVVGLYAAVVSHWKPTRVFSYGFHSAEVLSGFVNAVFLLVISASVFVNALARIHQPPHIHTDRLMAVSIAGLLVNLVGVVALGHAHSHGGSTGHGHSHGFGRSHNCSDDPHNHNHHSGEKHGHSHEIDAPNHGHSHGVKRENGHHSSYAHDDSGDTNLRGVYLHVLADTLGSVGVIISSFFVSNYGWNVADPICSVFIACAIAYSAMPLLLDTLGLLTLRAPGPLETANPIWLVKKVLALDGVLSVYNPFVWSQTRQFTCVSFCVQVDSAVSEQLILARIKELFRQHCPSIQHLTVQVEKDVIQDHLQAMGVKQHVLLKIPKCHTTDLYSLDGKHLHKQSDGQSTEINHLNSTDSLTIPLHTV